jgi:DsbC/DsbD-like thiol-disulfide interchange protein
MKLVLALIAVATGFCQSAPPAARTPDTHPVDARLVADASSVRPGQTFNAAIVLRMKPDWHVYWKNPGDSGLPVRARFSGPEGAGFGAIRWPLPVAFTQPGEIAGYGYTGEVLLPVEVTVPAEARAGAPLAISADVTWLACKDVCVPGRATHELAVAVGERIAAANGALFGAWSTRFATEAGDLARATTEASLAPDVTRGRIRVRLDWRRAPKAVELFPTADPALSISNVSIENDGLRSVVAFDAEIFEGQQLASKTLDALVVYTDQTGARRGTEFSIALRAPEKGSKGV